jgi:hypothetical protein
MLSLLVSLVIAVPLSAWIGSANDSSETINDATTVTFSHATSVAEARSRARLLHESIHGTLQVVHRDLFDDDDPQAIPSSSLKDVFHELTSEFQVEMKWLVVDTDVVNVDHQPGDAFEHAAVSALKRGQEHFEQFDAHRYRFAGSIRLGSQCLKCHVKRRSSNADRTAGLLISMPLHDVYSAR